MEKRAVIGIIDAEEGKGVRIINGKKYLGWAMYPTLEKAKKAIAESRWYAANHYRIIKNRKWNTYEIFVRLPTNEPVRLRRRRKK